MRSTTLVLALAAAVAACARGDATPVSPLPGEASLVSNEEHGHTAVADGKHIFRFDTFGDETFWTDTLRMHEVIRTSVSPKTALGVGLKVDAEALPASVVAGI